MSGDYEVGYGKPPKHTQFKKGQSGNRKGRPSGARGLKTDLREELSERVRVTENGKAKSLTKQQLIIKALTAKAAKGDVRAVAQVIQLVHQCFGLEGEQSSRRQLAAGDQAIVDAFFRRAAAGPENVP